MEHRSLRHELDFGLGLDFRLGLDSSPTLQKICLLLVASDPSSSESERMVERVSGVGANVLVS